MNVNGNLVASLKRGGHRGLLITKKYGPQILTGVGIVSGVTAAVMGAKATLKLEPIMDELDAGLAEVKHKRAELEGYSDVDYKRDLAFVYTRGVIELAKLYGPAVSLGGASIVCFISAQGIMQKRETAITAAYVALEKGVSDYRKRVEMALGADEERKLWHGLTVEQEHDTEAGEVREIVTVKDPNGLSPYAKFFDELNPRWQKNSEINLYFLRSQQNWANDMLRAQGHLFLNDVYKMLGFEPTTAGQAVGWFMDKDGDNYVDFGIFTRGDDERVRAFVNGLERSILLDFNVDGVIMDKI